MERLVGATSPLDVGKILIYHQIYIFLEQGFTGLVQVSKKSRTIALCPYVVLSI